MIPRSCLRWKQTGRIFKTVGLRWVPTGKIFTSSTTKVDSEPTNGSNEDITNQYECKQTLDVNAGTLNLSADWMREGQSRIKGQDQKLGERLRAWKLHSSPIKGASHTHWDHLG
ncbi:hypothetical protein Tco_0657963 [Tanacetum coccineum]